VSRAIGSFGLIPTTALADVADKSSKGNLATKYPEVYKELKKYRKDRNWVAMSKLMADPNVEAEVAKDYRKINEKYMDAKIKNIPSDVRGDLEALSWKLGANAAKKVYQKSGKQGVKNHWYVKKFRAWQKENSEQPEQEEQVTDQGR
jgi:hypothetical protein